MASAKSDEGKRNTAGSLEQIACRLASCRRAASAALLGQARNLLCAARLFGQDRRRHEAWLGEQGISWQSYCLLVKIDESFGGEVDHLAYYEPAAIALLADAGGPAIDAAKRIARQGGIVSFAVAAQLIFEAGGPAPAIPDGDGDGELSSLDIRAPRGDTSGHGSRDDHARRR